MDAPELAQSYGKISKYKLSDKIKGQWVAIEPVGKGLDRYGRVLAHVWLKQTNVSEWMISEGHGFYYRPVCANYPKGRDRYNYQPDTYIQAEKQAQRQKKGLWQQTRDQQWPCRFRQSHKR